MPDKFKATLLQAFTKKQLATTFKSQQTKKIYKIFHKVNSTSSYVIFLMECILCNMQYLGISETNYNNE